jgi:NAD+ synthase (glutamine-hydrolysing)
MNTWSDYLALYRKTKSFDSKEWIHDKCIKFNEYLGKFGLSGAVVSISGGIDSATILALLKYTSELPDSNLKKIMAINQPIHSSDWAQERAIELCNTLNIPITIIDQTDIHNQIVKKFESVHNGTPFSQGQLRSYLRTPTNYYASQLLKDQGFPAVVVGTGNRDEDGYLAYFCKYGDGAVDVQLIADLHKSEVYKVGKFLGIPESILEAPPSADLWEGHTDEEEMGFSYDFIEFYTGYYLNSEDKMTLSDDSKNEFLEFEKRCVEIHNRNAHKLAGVINL